MGVLLDDCPYEAFKAEVLCILYTHDQVTLRCADKELHVPPGAHQEQE